MNSKQRAVLAKIFQAPTARDLRWSTIHSLLVALGAEMIQGDGSRVSFRLNGVRATFHAPHGSKLTHVATVEDIRAFLAAAGVTP